MPWVPFVKAAQAMPGVRMRSEPYGRKLGRPRTYIVETREYVRGSGNMIIFTDGGTMNIADAKAFHWLVFVDEPDQGG